MRDKTEKSRTGDTWKSKQQDEGGLLTGGRTTDWTSLMSRTVTLGPPLGGRTVGLGRLDKRVPKRGTWYSQSTKTQAHGNRAEVWISKQNQRGKTK